MREKNLVVSAPTSSGKTLIGEMAAIHAALGDKKALYLVLLKALAEKKFRNFKQHCMAYGIEVVISSPDSNEYDY